MKKTKFLSLLLVLAMILGVLPMITFSTTAATKENLSGSADRWFKSDLYYDVEDTIAEAPLTIEAMVHLPTGAASNYWKQGTLLYGYDADTGNVAIQVGTNTTGRPYIKIVDTAGKSYAYTFGNDTTNGYSGWPWADGYTHIAFTVDTTAKKVYYYQKGTIQGVKTYSQGTLPTNLKWRIGGDLTEVNEYYFRGAVQYIAMYDEVLTLEEIVANKTNGAWDSSKSLIAAWDFSKQYSTKNAFIDRSGNGHDLIYTNKSGIKIDTYGTYVMDQHLTGNPETVEAWLFMPENYKNRGGTFFGNWDAKDSTYDFAFEVQTNGNPCFFYANADGTRETFRFTSADITSGAWTHVAYVHDEANGEARCYINGVLVETMTGATAMHETVTSSAIAYLGADRQAGLRQRYNGFIKELRVYSDVRTADEIAADYAGQTDYEDESFILHYDLTPELEEQNIPDLTGNGNSVTYVQDWWEYEDVEHAKDYAYSFAIVGDTQAITLKDSQSGTNNIGTIYDWIVDNVEEKKIQYVFGMGDITEKDTDAEWTLAKAAITKMDGVVPYSLLRGQGHDTVEQLNAYFADHEGYTSQISGYYVSGSVANVWHEFTVGNTDYLVMCLDMGVPDDVVEWASEVIAAHPAHRIILTTHAYLKADGSYLVKGDANCATSYDSSYNNGDAIWEKLASKFPNICMVMCGHKGSKSVVVSENTGDYGNTVTQLLVNPQGMDGNNPTGMVAMLYFSEDGKDVTVEYYATVMDRYKPTQTITVSYGSETAPEYEDLDANYLIAQDEESGLYSVIENEYFQFLGGSLRYKDEADNVLTDFSQAHIRFGYAFDTSFALEDADWYWNYGVAGDGLPGYKIGTNKTDANVTSLVITGVPEAYYTDDLEVQMVFRVMRDGVRYTVTDRVRTRSVYGVASAILDLGYENDDLVGDVQGIVDACQ